MLPKPPDCQLCPLERKGFGYAPASGPLSSPVLIVGESAGKTEAVQGTPFAGLAGAMLKRAMRLGGMDQSWFRIDNLVRCQPPRDWLSKAPWEHDAIAHCGRAYLSKTLAELHPVVVTAGGLSTRKLLDLDSWHFKVQNFHGTVQRDPLDRFWVVPTFHPSFLQRGATHLMDVLRVDLERAVEIARMELAGKPYERAPYTLTCDPRIEYFRAWADLVLQAVASGLEVDLAVDIETPDSSTAEEDERQDVSWRITRINFAVNGEEGVTVPFQEPWLTIVKELLASAATKLFWHRKFDAPRLLRAGCVIGGEWHDLMWAWHVLQSALPRGLGFVAPFYSDNPPWKHLAEEEPEEYAAFDGFVTWRVGQGIFRDLVATGMWPVYQRHVHELHRDILDPAEDIGLLLSRPALAKFGAELREHEGKLNRKLQDLVPETVRPLEKKEGWKKLPKGRSPEGVWEEAVVRVVQVCRACGAVEISKTHRCKDRALTPVVELTEAQVVRYFQRREFFSPRSWKQVLAYIKAKGHKPGKNPKSGADTTNRETLEALYKKHGDPFYKTLLDHRHVAKVLETYVEGMMGREASNGKAAKPGRMDALDRVHPTFTPKPSTMRLAAENPNTMNVIDDKEGENVAAGFRKCVVAGDEEYVRRHLEHWKETQIHPEPCVLLESDFVGIEAVIVGWLSGDPEYIRFSHLGIHGRLAALLLGRPADPSWPDDGLAAYFSEIKANEFFIYDRAKRNVHGSNYGLTVMGMVLRYPELFPTVKEAKHVQDLYWEMAPKVKGWQMSMRLFAHENHYLGGPGKHPYGYKHRFYDVISYRPITPTQARRREAKGLPVLELGGKPMAVELGGDAKKCIAFLPQSIARGVLTEAMFRLYKDKDHESYIGDAYFGRTPLRTPVHDSLLNEVPLSQVDRVVECLAREMLRPVEALPCPPEWGIGPYVNFGVEIKQGTDWGDKKRGGTMEKIFSARGGAGGTSTVAGDLRAVPSELDELGEDESEMTLA